MTDEETKVEENATEKMFSQDKVNEIVSERLAKEAEKTAKKYGDYDELKQKVGGYEKQISDMTAAHEKELAERDSKIQQYENDLVKQRIALETGLPADLAERLQGADEESLRADAEKLATYAKPQPAPKYEPEPTVEADPKKAALSKMLSNMKI